MPKSRANRSIAISMALHAALASSASRAEDRAGCPPESTLSLGMAGGGMAGGFDGGLPLPYDPLKELTCRTPEIGKSETVSIRGNISPTTVSHNYRLTRTGDKTYIAEVNLLFSRDPLYDGPEKTAAEVSEKYRAKVEKCLKQVNPYFKGPNGETLTIRLYKGQTPDGAMPEIPPHLISVGNSKSRSQSDSYGSAIDCLSIGHELLHVLGLCDEYHEDVLGYVIDPKTGKAELKSTGAPSPGFDCRAVGPENSIMSAPLKAYESVIPSETYTYTACVCSGAQDGCQKTIDQSLDSLSSQSSCPAGFKAEARSFEKRRDSAEKPDLQKFEFALTPTFQKTGEKPGDSPSLLLPAQFRSIIYPGCQDKNGLYYACSKNSYRTSKARNGEGCADMPEECKDPKKWLK